jgi:hypothetical protein
MGVRPDPGSYDRRVQPKDPTAAAAALKLFAWAYAHGAKMAEELDYVPMPASVVTSDRRGMRDNKRTWETLDAVIQHSTPPVQTGRERTYPYKLAARHISGLAPHIRRMGHGLGDLFAHARP